MTDPITPKPALVAVLHTTDFRGDHEAEVIEHFEVSLDETVGTLWARLPIKRVYSDKAHDWIELRIVRGR